MENGFEELVKDWYTNEHPEDEYGEQLDENITFWDAYEWLAEHGGEDGGDFYDFIGAGDSFIREEIFGHLAELMDCDYDIIYLQWLHGDNADFLAFSE